MRYVRYTPSNERSRRLSLHVKPGVSPRATLHVTLRVTLRVTPCVTLHSPATRGLASIDWSPAPV